MQHLLPAWALDKCPGVVELGLGSNVARRCLCIVLFFQHCELFGCKRRLCVDHVWERHGC